MEDQEDIEQEWDDDLIYVPSRLLKEPVVTLHWSNL